MAVYSGYETQEKIRNPQLRELIEEIIDVASGHDHDGTNSKSVSGTTPADGSVTNAKVNAAAAIAFSKLAALTSAQVLVGNGTNVPTAVAVTGDVALTNAGVTTVTDLTITNEAQGDVLYFDGTNWVRLGAGTSGQALLTNGAGANPSWGTPTIGTATAVSTATPVNAVAASGTLTISGVVIDGETVTIGSDVYEFCADAAQSLTAGSDFAADIEAHTTKSAGSLTVDTQPTAGDTMTIGAKVYTFVPNGTANADGEISIGANLGAAQTNIVAAINGSDSVNTAHTQVSAAAFAANASVITALVGGVAGDLIATTETFTAGSNIFDAATLGTTVAGADCTAANAVTALVTSITANDTAGVGGADGDGDTVVLTADTRGTAGNAIATTEAMANGAFGAVTLENGVDGTVGAQWDVEVDASYLYVCIAANTISGNNWRRIALGSAY